MVNGIKRLFNKDFNGLHEAAYLLGVSALASQILALIRDRLFASKFGAGELLDIYYASFRIPDLIYIFIATSAISAGFGIIYANMWNLYSLAELQHTVAPRILTRLNTFNVPFSF